MKFNIPMGDDEIKMHKPVCADFVSFRAGIRCAERVYQVADFDWPLLDATQESLREHMAQIKSDEALLRECLEQIERYQVKRQDFDRFDDLAAAIRERLGGTE